jgi:RNA polymerase sigma-70 factor (ECF subfamily)
MKSKSLSLSPCPVCSAFTDRELLQAIRNDNENAFSELFKRYWRRAFNMAYARVRSKEVTEEIVQDLFVSLWDKRASLSIKNMSSYIYVAIKHKVLNFIESQVVQQKYWDYQQTFLLQQEEATEKTVEYNELMAVIEEGMDYLSDKTKKVFRLNRLEGRSISETAEILKLSRKATQYHLTRSLKEMRLHLKDYILSATTILCVLI